MKKRLADYIAFNEKLISNYHINHHGLFLERKD